MEKCFLESPAGGLRLIPQCFCETAREEEPSSVTEVSAWEVRREPSLAGQDGAGHSPDTRLETLPSKPDLNVMEKAPSCLPSTPSQRAEPKAELSPAAAQGSPCPYKHPTWIHTGQRCWGCSRSSPSTARHPADSCFLWEQRTILQFLGTVNELNSLVIHPRDLPNSCPSSSLCKHLLQTVHAQAHLTGAMLC